ncbi:hypothetical protein AB0G20_38075 [Streptomyces sp. NPDC024017]|uniref:hypothetical protein n=1 Tax=Streptomyces sp. NPDC024017 TaxID=3154326 RepID=UPI0033FC0172
MDGELVVWDAAGRLAFEQLQNRAFDPPEKGQEPADDGSVRTAEQATEVARGFLLVAAPDGGSAGNAVLLVVSELVSNAVLHAGGVTGPCSASSCGPASVPAMSAALARISAQWAWAATTVTNKCSLR